MLLCDYLFYSYFFATMYMGTKSPPKVSISIAYNSYFIQKSGKKRLISVFSHGNMLTLAQVHILPHFMT